jgi:signal transduction histidine kinase
MLPSQAHDWRLHRLTVGEGVSLLDVGLGIALATFGIALVTGIISSPGRHGGLAAALAVLTMTLPVIWRRRAPVAMAVILGAGAAFNALVIGRMARCGPALPALLLCAFALGYQPVRRHWRAVGLAIGCLLGSAALQSFYDPNLSAIVLVGLTPMILALYWIGRLVESRGELVARLRERNEAIRQQRERTSRLAIQADRARIADGLDGTLSSRITEMATVAEAGRRALTEPRGTEAAQEAFVTIEQRGRETLNHMRQVVGTLLESGAPSEPQPTLSQLDRLVRQSGRADVRLNVAGRPRPLPAGVELSGYRTLEHLLEAFRDAPDTRVDIRVDFAADALELTVRGPATATADQQAALAAARARVAVHNGSLSSAEPNGQWEAVARFPLPAHA